MKVSTLKPAAAQASGRAAKGGPGEVRLIGGQWRRSKLPVADRPGLRPTPDRVRETLFNWLGQDLSGWRVLDAFAGSGALGFEAASRGAAQVQLLESDAALVASLQASRTRLGAATLQVLRTDALGWMASAADASFDLVLLDPPFGSDLAAPALVQAARLAGAGGYVYLETAAGAVNAAGTTEATGTSVVPVTLQPYRQLKAGAVQAQLFIRREA